MKHIAVDHKRKTAKKLMEVASEASSEGREDPEEGQEEGEEEEESQEEGGGGGKHAEDEVGGLGWWAYLVWTHA